jgi:hypothetical protein
MSNTKSKPLLQALNNKPKLQLHRTINISMVSIQSLFKNQIEVIIRITRKTTCYPLMQRRSRRKTKNCQIVSHMRPKVKMGKIATHKNIFLSTNISKTITITMVFRIKSHLRWSTSSQAMIGKQPQLLIRQPLQILLQIALYKLKKSWNISIQSPLSL